MRRYSIATMAALLAAWTVLGAPAEDRDAIVRAMIERSRLLDDLQFRIPTSLWERYLRETRRPETTAPVGVIAESAEYRLRVPTDGPRELAATVRFRILDLQRCGNLAVLSAARAWQDVQVNGQPADLPVVKGWLWLTPTAAGEVVVTARSVFGEARAEGGAFGLAIPRTLQTHVAFDSPGRWDATVTDVAAHIAGSDQGTVGRRSLSPRGKFRITWQPPVPERERPPRYDLRGAVAWDLGPAAQQLATRITVAIVAGRTDRLELALPPGADRVSVTGPDVRDTQGTGSQVTVFLRGRIAGQTRVTVRCEMPLGKGIRRLPGIGIRDGYWSDGTVVVTNTAGGSEVIPEQADGLRPMALADVPDEARALLAGPTALAYEIAARQWSLDVDVVDLGEFALRESMADLAHYQVAFLDDGTFMCKARYEVRNRARQFLRVQLPPGSTVLLARVNEKSSPLSPAPEGGEVWLLPLVRSTASVEGLVSFPVEIVFAARTDALRRRGEAALPLPRVDLPIAYAWANAYLPQGMTVSRWAGPMKRVDRFSSETATASLGYGRGLAAEGYKGMGKPTTQTTPEPAPEEKPARRGWFGLGGFLARAPQSEAKAETPETPPAVTAELEGEAAPEDSKDRSKEETVARPDSGAKYTDRGGRKAEPAKKPVKGKEVVDQPMAPVTPPVNTGLQLSLGRNYWRAGKDFYDNNDFDNAEENFRKVLELNPKSVEAANARRLLGNIQLAQGKLALKSRSERAAGAQVQLEIQVANKALDEQQVLFVEKGLKASREGRMDEAKEQFKAAQALGDQLVLQGADVREQHARLREVQTQLGSIQQRERKEAQKLYEQVEALQEQGNLEDALKTAQKLQEYDYGRTRGVQKKLQDLTVEAAKQKVAKARTSTVRTTRGQPLDKLENDFTADLYARQRAGEGPVDGRFRGEAAGLPGTQQRQDRLQRTEREKESLAQWYDTGGKRPAPGDRTGEKLSEGEDRRPAPREFRPTPQGGTAGGHFLGYGKGGEKVTRMYDVTDLTADFSRIRPDTKRLDPGTVVEHGGDANGDGVNGKELARQLNEAVAPIAGQSGRGKQAVEYRNGQLIVTDGAVVQKQVQQVLSDLRKTRGPQVQLGANIAQQEALGFVAESDEKAQVAAKPDSPAFQSFYYRNYAWQKSPRKGDQWGFDSGAATVSGVASKLTFNRGQKVDVNSINLSLPGSTAGQLGVRFSSGNNDLRFARVDEATFRTLVELDANTGRQVVSPNQRFQETIVGTDALVANGMIANVTFAADAGNTLNIVSNPINLEHTDYILIDNGSYLTAVKAGKMQHWTLGPTAVQFAEVPQDVDVPAVGRLVRFEKTLVEPTDELVIRAEYSWRAER